MSKASFLADENRALKEEIEYLKAQLADCADAYNSIHNSGPTEKDVADAYYQGQLDETNR